MIDHESYRLETSVVNSVRNSSLTRDIFQRCTICQGIYGKNILEAKATYNKILRNAILDIILHIVMQALNLSHSA